MNQADLSFPVSGCWSLARVFVSVFGRVNRFFTCLGVMSLCVWTYRHGDAVLLRLTVTGRPGRGRTALPGRMSRSGLCETQRHCVSTGVHKAEPPGFCPPHVHGALCQRLSRLLSHSPAFSSLALPGLVQMICAKLARRALAHSSQETTCTGMAGDRAVWHQPVFSLSRSLRFSSCLLTWGQRRVESSGRGYISHTGSF